MDLTELEREELEELLLQAQRQIEVLDREEQQARTDLRESLRSMIALLRGVIQDIAVDQPADPDNDVEAKPGQLTAIKDRLTALRAERDSEEDASRKKLLAYLIQTNVSDQRIIVNQLQLVRTVRDLLRYELDAIKEE